MVCPNCGYENHESSKFCRMCGTALVAVSQTNNVNYNENYDYYPPAPKLFYMENGNLVIPKFNLTLTKRMLMMCGAGLVGLIVLIVVISVIASAASAFSYPLTEQTIGFQYRSNTEDTAVIVDGEVLGYFDGKKEAESWSVLKDSCVVLTSNKELYLINEKAVASVAEEAAWVSLSADGSSLVYIGQDNSLSMINCADNTKTTLHDEALLYSNQVVISTDGKVVLWSAWDDEERKEYDLYCYYDGETKKLGSELVPVAASDKAERIYAYSRDNSATYRVSMDGEKEKIITGASKMLFNEDLSQSIYTTVDGKCYLYSEKLTDKVKLSNGYYAEPILPQKAAVDMQEGYNRLLIDDLTELPYLVAEGYDFYFYGANIYCFRNKTECEKLISGAEGAVLSPDGERIYYIRGEELRSVAVDSSMDTLSIAEDVETFFVTENGKYIYYINEDDELHAVKNEVNDEKIADDVDALYCIDGSTALFLYDLSSSTNRGALYTSKNGGKREKISEEVCDVILLDGMVLYSVYDEDTEGYNLFLFKDGKSTQLMNY